MNELNWFWIWVIVTILWWPAGLALAAIAVMVKLLSLIDNLWEWVCKGKWRAGGN